MTARARSSERGVALIVVLLLLAVLSILVAEFLYAIRIQAALLHNFESRVKARAGARAGQKAAAGLVLRADPDNSALFNNLQTGITLFQYRCLGGGSSSSFLALIGATAAPPTPPPAETSPGGTAGQEGCGFWSLDLPYQLSEVNLDIKIEDEQSRLNLNAMVKMGIKTETGSTPEIAFTLNRPYFCAIYELMRYQAFVHKLEISDADIFEMATAIMDYLDYGKIDGSFDSDKLTTFEVGDDYIPMKDGPLDTMDEIRLVPGMTDEFYDAIKDYLTVYPTMLDPQNPVEGNFSPDINVNSAPLEVIYALIRGSAATGENCDSTITEDMAMKIANQVVQTSVAPASTSSGSAAGTPSGVLIYERDFGLLPEAARNFLVKRATSQYRFFRVRVSAVTDDGLETVVTKVFRREPGKIVPLYYREE